jgi:hypothetical protein
MDKLIFVHKNWPFDPQIDYLKQIDVAFTCETEFDLMVELEAELKTKSTMNFFWICIVFLNSTCFLCGSGLCMFCARLKMMNGNICQVLNFGSSSNIRFDSMNAL